MAMRQLGRNIRVLSRTATVGSAARQFHPMIGSGGSARRLFCTRQQPPSHRDLPPRRESIWAEMKEWTPEETFVVAFGSVVYPLTVWFCCDCVLFLKEIWRNGGLEPRDP